MRYSLVPVLTIACHFVGTIAAPFPQSDGLDDGYSQEDFEAEYCIEEPDLYKRDLLQSYLDSSGEIAGLDGNIANAVLSGDNLVKRSLYKRQAGEGDENQGQGQGQPPEQPQNQPQGLLPQGQSGLQPQGQPQPGNQPSGSQSAQVPKTGSKARRFFSKFGFSCNKGDPKIQNDKPSTVPQGRSIADDPSAPVDQNVQTGNIPQIPQLNPEVIPVNQQENIQPNLNPQPIVEANPGSILSGNGLGSMAGSLNTGSNQGVPSGELNLNPQAFEGQQSLIPERNQALVGQGDFDLDSSNMGDSFIPRPIPPEPVYYGGKRNALRKTLGLPVKARKAPKGWVPNLAQPNPQIQPASGGSNSGYVPVSLEGETPGGPEEQAPLLPVVPQSKTKGGLFSNIFGGSRKDPQAQGESIRGVPQQPQIGGYRPITEPLGSGALFVSNPTSNLQVREPENIFRAGVDPQEGAGMAQGGDVLPEVWIGPNLNLEGEPSNPSVQPSALEQEESEQQEGNPLLQQEMEYILSEPNPNESGQQSEGLVSELQMPGAGDIGLEAFAPTRISEEIVRLKEAGPQVGDVLYSGQQMPEAKSNEESVDSENIIDLNTSGPYLPPANLVNSQYNAEVSNLGESMYIPSGAQGNVEGPPQVNIQQEPAINNGDQEGNPLLQSQAINSQSNFVQNGPNEAMEQVVEPEAQNSLMQSQVDNAPENQEGGGGADDISQPQEQSVESQISDPQIPVAQPVANVMPQGAGTGLVGSNQSKRTKPLQAQNWFQQQRNNEYYLPGAVMGDDDQGQFSFLSNPNK